MIGVPNDVSIICGACAMQINAHAKIESVEMGVMENGQPYRLTTYLVASEGNN